MAHASSASSLDTVGLGLGLPLARKGTQDSAIQDGVVQESLVGAGGSGLGAGLGLGVQQFMQAAIAQAALGQARVLEW